ncbi:hypothetical protein JOF29_001276 [Kribbella aluminosa]|uniref:Uncharacterized protein n=1 Tax=Kribbella aluminosa TaxID=416017 RepID=A0ABS4UF03_9ACTN|nr:hypothetical protein [Kribbella aluminosa]MBP2350193.1 hypothetical protein [Kribbella aluminosa]
MAASSSTARISASLTERSSSADILPYAGKLAKVDGVGGVLR